MSGIGINRILPVSTLLAESEVIDIKNGPVRIHSAVVSDHSSGSLVLNGGITVQGTSPSTSLLSGGGATVYGGMSVNKNVMIGGALSVVDASAQMPRFQVGSVVDNLITLSADGVDNQLSVTNSRVGVFAPLVVENSVTVGSSLVVGTDTEIGGKLKVNGSGLTLGTSTSSDTWINFRDKAQLLVDTGGSVVLTTGSNFTTTGRRFVVDSTGKVFVNGTSGTSDFNVTGSIAVTDEINVNSGAVILGHDNSVGKLALNGQLGDTPILPLYVNGLDSDDVSLFLSSSTAANVYLAKMYATASTRAVLAVGQSLTESGLLGYSYHTGSLTGSSYVSLGTNYNPDTLSVTGTRVGVNSTAPSCSLDVVGNIAVSGDSKLSGVSTGALHVAGGLGVTGFLNTGGVVSSKNVIARSSTGSPQFVALPTIDGGQSAIRFYRNSDLAVSVPGDVWNVGHNTFGSGSGTFEICSNTSLLLRGVHSGSNTRVEIPSGVTVAADQNTASVTSGGLGLTGDFVIDGAIMFANSGVSDGPGLEQRAAGSKLVLKSSTTSTTTDTAIGVSSQDMWLSVADTSGAFVFYSGTTVAGTVDGTGAANFGKSVTTVDVSATNLTVGGSSVMSGGVTVNSLSYFSSGINVSGAISGDVEWAGEIINVPRGGTGTNTHSQDHLLIGNDQSAIKTLSGLKYTAQDGLTVPGDTTIQGNLSLDQQLLAQEVVIDDSCFIGDVCFIGTTHTSGGQVIKVCNGNLGFTGSGTLHDAAVIGYSAGNFFVTTGTWGSQVDRLTISTAGVCTLNSLVSNSNAVINGTLDVVQDSTFSSGLFVNSTTGSSSVTTGALQVSGGAAVKGNVHLGGDVVVYGDLYVSGNQNAVSSINTFVADNAVVLNAGPSGSRNAALLMQRFQKDNDNGSGDVVAGEYKVSFVLGSQVVAGPNEVVLPSTASSVNGVYNGHWIKIDSGFSADQTRKIVGYTGSTRVATVSSAWTDQNPSIADTVSLYNKPYTGIMYDETMDIMRIVCSSSDPAQQAIEVSDDLGLMSKTLHVSSTEGSTSEVTGSVIASGGLTVKCTTDATSNTCGNALTCYGGGAFNGRLFVRDDVILSGVSLNSKVSDIPTEYSFSAANNQTTPVIWWSGGFSSFHFVVTVTVAADINLYAQFILRGLNKGQTYGLFADYIGDSTGVSFKLDTLGNLQYTSGDYSGFQSLTFKWRSTIISG